MKCGAHLLPVAVVCACCCPSAVHDLQPADAEGRARLPTSASLAANQLRIGLDERRLSRADLAHDAAILCRMLMVQVRVMHYTTAGVRCMLYNRVHQMQLLSRCTRRRDRTAFALCQLDRHRHSPLFSQLVDTIRGAIVHHTTAMPLGLAHQYTTTCMMRAHSTLWRQQPHTPRQMTCRYSVSGCGMPPIKHAAGLAT